MREAHDTRDVEIRARRRRLVCDATEEVWAAERTDQTRPACSQCHAATERIAELERRHVSRAVNPHAAALGRLGGLKGGPTRAARLSARRRRDVARAAARARWSRTPE